jgi:lipoprotein-anchoring transpeptidase ErfK/SrfK
MSIRLSRREFLKLSVLSLGSLAFSPYFPVTEEFDNGNIARVANTSVSVYKYPNEDSRIICQRYRDEILHIYEDVYPPTGPGYNPHWYRVWQGYVHSAYVVPVKIQHNQPLTSVPETGQLVELTVPYTQCMRYTKYDGWNPFFRLYYGSVHWIHGIGEGPDGEPWYLLNDMGYEFHVPASHFRPITAEELTPINGSVDPDKKRIEVSLGTQTLTAYEGDEVVLKTKISSGVPGLGKNENGVSTTTPSGEFEIYAKRPSVHMGDGNLTADPEAYELPGIPWVSYFYETGVAFHGTYWHDNFGMTMSHGCINMRTEEAMWLYRWSMPYAGSNDWVKAKGHGTKVTVTKT